MRIRWPFAIAVIVAAAFLFLDPRALLGGYSYDERDLRTAIEGRWRLAASGEAIELTIRQADHEVHAHRSSLVRSADACGSRTLVRSAHACIDDTRMPLDILLATGEHVDGLFSVLGVDFRRGGLRFVLPDGRAVEARILPAGTADEVTLGDRAASLVRR